MSGHRISIGGFNVPLHSTSERSSVTDTTPPATPEPKPTSRQGASLSIGGFRAPTAPPKTPPAAPVQQPASPKAPHLQLVQPPADQPSPKPEKQSEMPWRYQVFWRGALGSGHSDVSLSRKITASEHIEAVANLIGQETGLKVTITTFNLLDAPPAATTQWARRRASSRRTAEPSDPNPWHYWVAFDFKGGDPGGGACEVTRNIKIGSDADLPALADAIAQWVKRPVRITSTTLLRGPASD